MTSKDILQWPGVFLTVLCLAGCKYDNQFENVPSSQQHAILTAQPAEFFFDRGPLITHIDRRKTTFWRSKEHYLITPGVHELCIVADREPYGFAPVKFTASAGHHYDVRYEAHRTAAGLYDVTSTPAIFIVRSARDQSDR